MKMSIVLSKVDEDVNSVIKG